MRPPDPSDTGELPPKPSPDEKHGSGLADCFRAIEDEALDQPIVEPAKAKTPAEKHSNEDDSVHCEQDEQSAVERGNRAE